MKICTVVGARPQFVKVAPVSRALAAQDWREVLIHTGQHYDYAMSDIFFDELRLARPDYNLGVGSGSHGAQTGRMLIQIEGVLMAERPDITLVYGDTNSTLAAALAAVKLSIPTAHVEAGLRSFNRLMPEEHNRVLADHIAELLFCPTRTAVENLAAEGIVEGVYPVGDVMYDSILFNTALAERHADPLARLGLSPSEYALATIHRPYNTDQPENLAGILEAFARLPHIVLFLTHPRTCKVIRQHGLSTASNVRLLEPVGYLDMLVLEKHAHVILTDSGGVQKEAYFQAVPCVTIRPETEWVETVQAGWNTLADPTPESILAALGGPRPASSPPVFGDGRAAEHIVKHLADWDRSGRRARSPASILYEHGAVEDI